MLKSLSQILIPASAGTALIVGSAIGVANWDMGKDAIAQLETELSGAQSAAEQAQTRADAEADRAATFQNEAATAKAMAGSQAKKSLRTNAALATVTSLKA